MNFLIRFAASHKNLIGYELAAYLPNHEIKWLRNNLALAEATAAEMQVVLKNHSSVKYIISNPTFLERKALINPKTSGKQIHYTLLPPKSTFAARYYHLGEKNELYIAEEIEAKIGSWILLQQNNLRVNLTNPEYTFYSVSWDERGANGWLFGENNYSAISWRHPKEGPYFQGGAMKPRLCRLLVNLLFPLEAIVLDPFCGHGGILREIADLKSYAIGIEVSKKVARELLENNRFFGYADLIDVIMGDSLNPPYRTQAFDQAVTDPPYAIQTTTKGLDREILLEKWLSKQGNEVTIVFTTPNDMLNNLPQNWETDLDEDDFVHKSLSRRVRRIKRMTL